MGVLRQAARAATPTPLLRAYHRRGLRKAAEPFRGATNEEIFSKVYHGPYWGNDSSEDYTSGDGSADLNAVATYVEAVRTFLDTLGEPPDVVDLGCGDFGVGVQIRPSCKRYVACDVVPAVVERNRVKFADHDVEFRQVDLTRDELPDGQVLFVRQVLQHLSNDGIAAAVPGFGKYTHLVITEHLADGRFTPNLDMPTGPYIRTGIKSGVDLAEPPFSIPFRSKEVLCEVPKTHSIIRTTLYTMS